MESIIKNYILRSIVNEPVIFCNSTPVNIYDGGRKYIIRITVNDEPCLLEIGLNKLRALNQELLQYKPITDKIFTYSDGHWSLYTTELLYRAFNK